CMLSSKRDGVNLLLSSWSVPEAVRNRGLRAGRRLDPEAPGEDRRDCLRVYCFGPNAGPDAETVDQKWYVPIVRVRRAVGGSRVQRLAQDVVRLQNHGHVAAPFRMKRAADEFPERIVLKRAPAQLRAGVGPLDAGLPGEPPGQRLLDLGG